MTDGRQVKLARAGFIALLVLALVLALRVVPNPVIDTDLADVRPQLLSDAASKYATDALQSYAEKRIILLVSGADEDTVLDAEYQLRSALANLPEISLLPDNQELFSSLVSGLLPYRFLLQSDEQKERLAELTSLQLAQSAVEKLHQGASQSGLLEFEKDPLSWHGDTLLAILEKLRLGDSDLQSATAHSALVSLNIERGALNVSAQEKLLAELNQATEAVQLEFDVQIERSGIFFFAADAAKNAKQDISTISMGSSIGIVLLLLAAFGSLRALILPAMSVLMGVGFAFLVIHSIYGNVHVLTIVFGASLIGVVIDYSLHYFYHQSAADSKASRSNLFRALLLSLLTSLIGYAALSFSSLEALQKIAFFSCCGLLMAWLCVVSFGDFFSSENLKGRRSIVVSASTFLSQQLAHVTQKTALAAALLLILAAGLIVSLGQPFSEDPRVFFTPSKAILESEQKVAQVANDYEPGRYLTIVGRDTEQVYLRHKELLAAIDASNGLNRDGLSSLMDWVPSPAVQLENYQLQAKLYGESGVADQFTQLLGGAQRAVSAIKAEYLGAARRTLDPAKVADFMGESLPPFWIALPDGSFKNNRVLSFVLIRKGFSADELESIASNLSGVEYVNMVAATQRALSAQRVSASLMLLVAYVLISLLILLRYRSVRALWMILVPATSSAAVVVICFAAGTPLNLFHMMALFLILGFGMDYTIFTKEFSGQPSLTLPAILLSALTSMLSFGLLSLSSIPIVFSFGLALLIGNGVNLIATFIVTSLVDQSGTSIQTHDTTA